MARLSVRVYAELNDHLPQERRMTEFEVDLDLPSAVKEVLATIGIPEDEVDLVLANGESVPLSHPVKDGDKISVYPVFESFDIGSLMKIRVRPLRQNKFVLDTHLGKLACHLRMLGFDSCYRNDYTDAELIAISNNEQRILLSRDRQLLASESLTRRYLVQGVDPRLQLLEVLRRFDLFDCINPFQRCLRCNAPLEPVSKEDVIHRLPPKTRQFFGEFQSCPACNRIYWKGSHYSRMQTFIQALLQEAHTPLYRHDSRTA